VYFVPASEEWSNSSEESKGGNEISFSLLFPGTGEILRTLSGTVISHKFGSVCLHVCVIVLRKNTIIIGKRLLCCALIGMAMDCLLESGHHTHDKR
jgi:hypothetical protein